MSYIRLNIIDQNQTINGEVHGSEGDAIIAALAAEPETIDELALAFARFTLDQAARQQDQAQEFTQVAVPLTQVQDDVPTLPHHHESPFRWFAQHENFEPHDAGIVIVDLAARVVAVDSTYSMPAAEGEICLFIGNQRTATGAFSSAATRQEDCPHQDENAHQHHTDSQKGKLPRDFIDDAAEPFAEDESEDDRQTSGSASFDADPEADNDYPFYVDEAALAELNALADDAPDEISLPYRLADDWLFVYSIPEYEGICRKRREARQMIKPLEARAVLYGKPLLRFIADECLAAREAFAAAAKQNAGAFVTIDNSLERISEAQYDIIMQLHLKWWMTLRDDLQGQSPRQVLLAKRDFINGDLHSRQLQWSFTNHCPPPLSTTSKAYLYAGFGTHESVVYYDLVRHLLGEYLARLQAQADISSEELREFLEQTKVFWLEMPNHSYSGKIPSSYIERERQRIPFVMSAQEGIMDEDCPLCLMSEIFDTPGFWHLDGSHMDYCFEFSFYASLEEWQAEQTEWEEFNKKFERDWQARQEKSSPDEAFDMPDDDEPLIH